MTKKLSALNRMAAGLILISTGLGYGFGQAVSTEPASVENKNESELMLPIAPSTTEAASAVISRTHMESTENFGHALPTFNYGSHSGTAKRDARFDQFVHNSFTTPALASNLFDAVQAQWRKTWPGYGKGIDGFEKRYYAVTAGHVTNNFFGTYFFPTLLHQNPRSPRLGSNSGVWRRCGYGLSRLVVIRDDNGRQTVNSSLLFSIVASSAVRNLYYPARQRGFSPSVSRIQGSVVDSVQGNLSREFLPDVERFLWKHAPSGIQRITKGLPFAKKWEPAAFFEAPKDVRAQ